MTDTIQQIYFDLDGTLIGTSGDVKPSVWTLIDELRGRVGFAVCTGRTRAGVAQQIAQRLSPDGRHIFENGAMISRANGGEATAETLPVDDLRLLVGAAAKIDATVEFYTARGVFVSRLDDDCRAHADALRIAPVEADLAEVAHEGGVYRAHWIMRDHALPAVRALRFEAADIGFASSPVMPELTFASVTRAGVSKGSAARQHAAALGVDLADAAAIGDADSDVPLLEVVGHPFVTANAPAELRARFEVLGHVDDDGVEPLLQRLLR